jgi:hypothetical protein
MGYKKLFANTKGAWYIGGGIDYSFGTSESDGRVKWDNEFSDLHLMANGGWRWRIPTAGLCWVSARSSDRRSR